MQTLTPIGDPARMRPSIRRYGFTYADPIGVHPLADGREAEVLWVSYSSTHVNIIVSVLGDGEALMATNICRLNAATTSERLLQELES
jgi:hypothetical protein